VKCEKPEQPANDQNCCNDPQHDSISLELGAKLSSLYSRAQHRCLSTVERLADLACASQREMSVRLGTLRVVTALSGGIVANPELNWSLPSALTSFGSNRQADGQAACPVVDCTTT
jgi:microcystin degradation protein MlrC